MDHSILHGKAIKFLLLVSVFSILFTHSSLISFLVQFSNAFISSLNVRHFSSYTFDKNYMFLLCNGLLVCIVKNSGLIGTSAEGSSLNNDEDDVKINVESSEVETKAELAKEDQVVNVGSEQVLLEEECDLVNVEDHKEFEGEIEEEEEEEEEEEAEVLSTEELNKKCDEFIRRIREGIKLEVQQSMIMVSCH